MEFPKSWARTDFYAVLGIDRGSSAEEIKSAYLWNARKFHPDMNQGDERATQRFRKIQEAYDVLSNPETKAQYDQFLNLQDWSRPSNLEHDSASKSKESGKYERGDRSESPPRKSGNRSVFAISIVLLILLIVSSILGSGLFSSLLGREDPWESTRSSEEVNALSEECAPAGAVVDGIFVTGDTGKAPELSFSAPLFAQTTQRRVVIEGTGEEVRKLDEVLISYALYSGNSGQLLGFLGYEDEPPVLFPVNLSNSTLRGVSHTLLCSRVGSRVIGIIPPEEAYGMDGAAEYGLEPGASLIFVADIRAIQ